MMAVLPDISGRLFAAPGDDIVALTAEGTVDFARFRADVAACYKQLSEYEARCWGLFCEDSYAFLVAMCALLLKGNTPLLLPHAQPAVLDNIDEAQGLLTDCDCDIDGVPQLRIAFADKSVACAALPQFPNCPPDIVLYTSGSSGKPKRIVKTLVQLHTEVQMLDSLWGEMLQAAAVFATVTHQHIYGLLFRVLWPFLSGRCFDSRTYQYPEPLLQQVLLRPRSALISSPAHLKRMPELVKLQPLRGNMACIFSSGGPLSNRAVVTLHQITGADVYEVFGSTETGGVAYRCQQELDKETAWQVLPGVEWRIEPVRGILSIRSPYEGSGQWYMMSDCVEASGDNKFLLHGRNDKIVKIEEKRLSLSEVEQRLSTCAWIAEAAATVLYGVRGQVAIVAVLSSSGLALYQQEGKRRFDQRMRNYMTQYFEAVLLPKKWRYVEHLPYNAQGKLPQAVLQALFKPKTSEMEPHIRLLEKSLDQVILELRLPETLIYFDGHFPDDPVLPGVVQLHWAAVLAERYLEVAAGYQHMEAVKFHEFIRPGDTVSLHLKTEPEARKLYFSYESHKGRHSSGRLLMD